jgi:hypothetical protein
MNSPREPGGPRAACRATGRRRPSSARVELKPASRHARDVCPTREPRKPYTTGGESPDARPISDPYIELEDFARWFADWWLRRGRNLADTHGR